MTGIAGKLVFTFDEGLDPFHGLFQRGGQCTNLIIDKIPGKICGQFSGAKFIHLVRQVNDRGDDFAGGQPAHPEPQADHQNHAGGQYHGNS